MAVHVQRTSTVPTIERIRSRRHPAGQSRSCKEVVALVRDVVRRSATVEDAMAAVKAIDDAWSKASGTACDATQFLLTILEFSDSVTEAVRVVEMLDNDASLREPLERFRTYIETDFPGARICITPGDEFVSACLIAMIPAEDYPAFKRGYDRIRGWSVENYSELGRIIHISPQRLYDDV